MKTTKRLNDRFTQKLTPKNPTQTAGQAIKTIAEAADDVVGAAKLAAAQVKRLIDADVAAKVSPTVQAALGRLETKSVALQKLVDTVATSGKPPSPRVAAQIATLQRDLTVNARAVQKAGPEALAALGASDAFKQAQQGLQRFLSTPEGVPTRAGRALKGIETLGKIADAASAATSAYAAYNDSVFSSQTGRIVDAGLTGAVRFGADRAFGLFDAGLGLVGVDDKNQIAPTIAQGSRAITSFAQALATGDTAALARFRQQVQDGPFVLRELDGVGQRLADTRVLDTIFSYLDTAVGTVTGNEDQVRRARALRDNDE